MTGGGDLDVRYARQARFSAIGAEGQRRLLQARAAVVGVGALGCAIANHLARAGVGSLTLIDRDIVDRSNLQRQMLFDEADAAAGTPKAAAAAGRLAAVNGGISITPRIADLNAFNAERLLEDADIVLDGTDNFSARYLINEFSVKHGVPWVYGGAVGASGMTLTVVPEATPCLRCLFPSAPPGGALDTCETAGVLAPIVDTIASVQAMEAIKLLSGRSDALHGSLLQIDLWSSQWQSLAVGGARDPDCPVCGRREFEALEGEAEDDGAAAVSLCGRSTVQVMPGRPLALDLQALEPRLRRAGSAELTAYSLRLQLPGGVTFVLFEDGRALVIGTEEAQTARRIYAELLGE
ncbi:ThiF family adenylyltransferase [Cohnella hongkongensis]|uniref:ThiF family adenylyltransferase n=1 Tax=Cohnella hongkongensis TaxID=178337 RepID=A0ABV9FIB0_9BACL